MLKQILRQLKRPLDDIARVEVMLGPDRDLIVFMLFYSMRGRFAYYTDVFPASIIDEMREKYIFQVIVKVWGEHSL